MRSKEDDRRRCQLPIDSSFQDTVTTETKLVTKNYLRVTKPSAVNAFSMATIVR